VPKVRFLNELVTVEFLRKPPFVMLLSSKVSRSIAHVTHINCRGMESAGDAGYGLFRQGQYLFLDCTRAFSSR